MHRLILCFAVVFLALGPLLAQEAPVPPPSGSGRLARLARQIEPDLHGRPERLAQYIDFFGAQLGNDPRLFAYRVDARHDSQHDDQRGVTLSGYVEFPETRRGLEQFLRVLGFDVRENHIETLPSDRLGSKIFGLVKTTHTLSYDRPDGQEVVTDCLLGEPLYLLRAEGDWLLVHSGEGYLGYVAAQDIEQVAQAAFDDYTTAPSVTLTADHEAGDQLLLPAGARLKKVDQEAGSCVCQLPSGQTVSVPDEKCLPVQPPAEQIDTAIANGRRLLGTPYHWGGKTSSGIDCSGLVQVAFSTIGLHLPRDSYQQFYLGKLVATRWHRARLEPGDTLYFVGTHGKIRHTALYIGDDQFLQAEMPHVGISSFNPEHDNYDERRDRSFVFAKRLW